MSHDTITGRLADLVGIAGFYVDAFGQPTAIDLERRRGILRHLGFPAGTEDEARDSLARAEAHRNGLLPLLVVVEANRPSEVLLRDPGAAEATWHVVEEIGEVSSGEGSLRRSAAGGFLRLPPLPVGYHRLWVSCGGRSATATILCAPARCWQPGWMSGDTEDGGGGKAWGLAAQVYGLRSGTNLGIGSYPDIEEAAVGAAGFGATFLGLSPLHALFPSDRQKVSPYSPSSRLFLETLHIDPKRVPDFAGSEAARLLSEDGRAERIAALREAGLVDAEGVWAELSPVLEALWAERRHRRDPDVEAFRRSMGQPLRAHATFEALSERFAAEGHAWLGAWPEAFRSRAAPGVATFAESAEDRVSYHAWLQYLADRQLGQASVAARRAGMSIGLYRDLAVGSDRGGSELWSNPDWFGATLSIGAPPDLLAPNGQDWGLPPLHPLVLEQTGLAAFRALVAANMRHAGAIRIDHAFQLQRLYVIPVGETGRAGAYVDYPFEAMLAVLRIESHRGKALVIGEDLGTGPEGFSDAIMRSGILSYRVLPFERTPDGGFKPPASYPREALTVLTTHDLPTLAGWWRGLDTDLRLALGTYEPDRADQERRERVTERHRLMEALAAEHLVASAEPTTDAPSDAVMRFLARTLSALNAIQYEDVLGAMNQPNMPGTNEGHPNWRRKLESDLSTINEPGGPLAKVAASLSAEGRGSRASASPLASPPPCATYRIQFHKGFTFDDATRIVPYLAELGISHLYASPIQTARPGSTHGYDIVDHATINPELGGEDGFYRLSDALRRHGLGLVLDIVPNHMGVGGADNGRWLSVLEWGPLSPHVHDFDIDWERLGAGGKLVVPVLGDRYGDALEKGDLKLAFDAREGSFSVHHHEHRLPLTPLSYPLILDRALAAIDRLEGESEVIAVSERLRSMVDETAGERRALFPAEGDALKRRLAEAVAASPELARALDRAVSVVNGVPDLPESFGTLHRILEMQSYRPAHWRVAASDINYRRFFDINGLAGLRVEVPEVFRSTHDLVFRLIREGRIQGLRIDHVDGLADPEGYLKALQAAVGPGFYILVEKILEPGEPLRPWPISGTTGYDVLNTIDGVLVDQGVAARFGRLYGELTGDTAGYGERLRAAKTEILQSSFASELEVLVSDLKRIADGDRRTRDYTVYGMRVALSEIIARFPVYRSYITEGAPSPEDVELIETTIASAKRHSRLPDRSIHDFTASALLGRIETEGAGRPAPDHVARFRRRFQQLTGPVMAKSLEDTLFYRYAPLLALNEVGGDPGHFGIPADLFHAAQSERAARWPDAMIATATHDTKRGEDARARLLALTLIPDEWESALEDWREVTGHLLGHASGEVAPDANDQYILLQGLLGAWPTELLESDDADAILDFANRFKGFAEKAFREAKRHTSWIAPNAHYEEAVAALIEGVLKPGSVFLHRFRPLARRLAEAGYRNGFVRTVLKCTLPGVPDIYQGTEFWDFSLVDPDNRRPVDYEAREAGLAGKTSLRMLAGNPADGLLKQQLLRLLLADRRDHPDFYAQADYRPLQVEGAGRDAVLAFARRRGSDEMATAILRLPLGRDGQTPLDAGLVIGEGQWRDILTGRDLVCERGRIAVADLFAELPAAVLRKNA